MKLRKIFSALCAIAILTATLPTVSAAEVEPLSEYAGQTIAVQAIEETESGLVSHVVEVTIPEGATETEARTLIYATAFEWDMVSAHSDDFSVTGFEGKYDFSLFDEEIIFSKTLPSTLNELYFTFVMPYMPLGGKIEVKLTNSNYSYPTRWLSAEAVDIPGKVVREVVFKVSAIPMNKGDKITAYAKSDVLVYIDTCNITGYYRY